MTHPSPPSAIAAGESLARASPARETTWREIAGLLEDLAERAKSETDPRRFYSDLLDGVLRVSLAAAGAVWVREEGQPWRRAAQLGLAEFFGPTGSTSAAAHEAHQALVEAVAAAGQACCQTLALGPFDAAQDAPRAGVRIAAPLPFETGVAGVIELFADRDTSPAVQNGLRELLLAAGELAADFERRQRLRAYAEQEAHRRRLDTFVRDVLQHLDRASLAATIVNEGRRLMECDRVSLVRCRHATARVMAVSGVDTLDPRSSSIRAMERLALAAHKTAAPLWRSIETTEADSDAARAADDYLRQTKAALVGAIPLHGASHAAAPAVLIVEVFAPGANRDLLERRARDVAERCAPAVGLTAKIESLPLMWLSRRLARAGGLAPLHRRRLRTVVAVLLLLATPALLLLPVDFTIEARGELQPVHQERIYAPRDGVVVDFPALHAAQADAASPQTAYSVPRDAVVIELENADLAYELTSVLGQQATSAQRLDTISVTLDRLARSGAEDQARFDELTAEKLELEVALRSLAERLAILQREAAELSIAANLAGQVQTWDVVAQLQSRPVRQGQLLMTIADVAGPWRLELHVADNDIGHVNAARRAAPGPLEVRFVKKSEPGRVCRARVEQVALASEPVEHFGPAVRVTAAVHPDDAQALLRPGTSVIAKIDCGRRALGYVWLREALEVVRRNIWF